AAVIVCSLDARSKRTRRFPRRPPPVAARAGAVPAAEMPDMTKGPRRAPLSSLSFVSLVSALGGPRVLCRLGLRLLPDEPDRCRHLGRPLAPAVTHSARARPSARSEDG